MRPWIFVAFSAPIVAASAVFIVYPIGQVTACAGNKLIKTDRLLSGEDRGDGVY
jgi:hypothetical protein